MPYTEHVLAQYESRLPAADVTREKLQRYLRQADMSTRQFANLSGYSYSAINLFLGNRYTQGRDIRTDLPVRDAIESVMARYPVGSLSEQAEGHVYETENGEDLRRWFHHCHENRALAFCYGPPGSQKSFVLEHLVANFNRRELKDDASRNRAFYIYCSIDVRPRDLLAKMCVEAGAIGGATLQKCLGGLRLHLRDTKTLFVLDEAQHLGIPSLEAVRELHDRSPQIGCLLAGSHGLKKMFDQRAAELEQWNSRMDAGIELRGVSEARATEIAKTEMPHLSQKQVKALVDGAWVKDAYSHDHRMYLNVRRLFKNIVARRRREEEKVAEAGAA